jgi:SAM-dependent methyltransferase
MFYFIHYIYNLLPKQTAFFIQKCYLAAICQTFCNYTPGKYILFYFNNPLLMCINLKLLTRRHPIRPVKGNTYYGEQASAYVEERLKQDWWHSEQRVMQQILSELPDGLKVLDVPFGTGRFVPFYLEKNMDVSGLDISEEMLQSAKKNLKEDYDKCHLSIGTAENLPFEDNAFDLVVCFRFLQAIIPFGMVKNVLPELSRVTKSYAILELNIRKDKKLFGLPPRNHQAMRGSLKRAKIEALLNNSGFRILKIYPISERKSNVVSAVLCEKI